MQLKERMQDDVAILELKGKLMGGSETQEIHTKIKELVEEGKTKVIIDLGNVTWMNSTGLGAIMSSYSTLRNADGDLKLIRVTEKVKSLFMVTKLITIFDTFESEKKALAAFKK
ncbi:STAS domain-containing protein [candidate division KSB1 bacterium]|nr:STAS domain-containing protein [candidate division KSB1 bacterium]